MWNVEKKSASRVDFPPTWWAIMHSDAKAGAHDGENAGVSVRQ